jgi:hypothetical protein
MDVSSLRALSGWLAHSTLSARLQGAMWVIPMIQTVHILAVAVAIASAFLLDLRVIGAFASGERSDRVAKRLLPWARGAIAVLAVSGLLLIIAEPERCLTNAAFWSKMLMLILALTTTRILHNGIRRTFAFWEISPLRRVTGKIIAGASLLLWSGVVLAGRWIAYLGAPR